jgi:hypothetical protein
MKTDPQSLVLLIAGAAFLAYLLVKLLIGREGRGEAYAAAQRSLRAAKARANDRALPNRERAAAFREAAGAALEGMHRPGLAATLARRAEHLDPGNPETVGLLGLALRRGARYSALERFLWKQLAELEGPSAHGYERAFDELVALYEGPLHRPETAQVLRRFRGVSC